MATPTIPPRPARAQNTNNAGSPSMDIPKIPPRPSKRGADRSVSPHRDSYARSPLNDPAFLHNGLRQQPPQRRENRLSVDLPPRPPSVTLPSIGQEGSEYASFEDLSKTLSQDREKDVSPQHTKNVAGDLPLHAPKASVPSSTAKSRIQTVTRTDSSQAAAVGIGRLAPDDRSAHGADSGHSDSSTGVHSRPSSMHKDDEEHGIPVIGVQVPMYPNAGDVQAPTPSPYEQQGGATGGGPFGKPTASGRHHGRTKSGREIFHGPPGSYGLHGHGVIPKDEFEKSWYAKHPDELKREKAGEYGPHIQENRKDYHWVGDDLVKLVHSSGTKGLGMATARESIGTPDEQIGYMASEEYALRMTSPRPASGRPASISGKSGSQVESPLRQANFPVDQLAKRQALADETGDDTIHIDPPSHRASKIHGGGYDPPTEDLGPEGGNTEEEGGWVSERGYGVPILASDEIEKHPGAEFRQPAVSPELERRGSGEYTVNEFDGTPAYITKQRPRSRNSSKNLGGQAGTKLQRFSSPTNLDRSGTPLESTKEYEPLFPEEEQHAEKPRTAATKLKRPDLARHHFPSQDVWEDTPSSLQLETTVENPQGPEEPRTPADADADAGKVFENPEAELARKEHITKEDQQSFLPEHTKRFANKHLAKEHLGAPSRPGMPQRFPSHDIWEDAPDHGQLVATVSSPQTEDTNDYGDDSPVVDKPAVPQRPMIPARPQKAKDSPSEDKKGPVIPERPKPQVPIRPAKPTNKSSEKVPTLESQSAEATQPKAKPQVPARPGGSKIAALQAGFLKDLNSKLGLGPQAPKVKEPEQEEEEEAPKPLQDARKGRAKGPQRRKPTSSPSPAATITAEVAVPRLNLAVSEISAIWSIDEQGALDVPAAQIAAKIQQALAPPSVKETHPEHVEQPEDDENETEDALQTTQAAGKAHAITGSAIQGREPELEPDAPVKAQKEASSDSHSLEELESVRSAGTAKAAPLDPELVEGAPTKQPVPDVADSEATTRDHAP